MELYINKYNSVRIDAGDAITPSSIFIEDVSEPELIDQLATYGYLNNIISNIDLNDVIAYHGVEEILETIGEQRVREHVTEYWTQSDEEHE